jgi:hypothetical protein
MLISDSLFAIKCSFGFKSDWSRGVGAQRPSFCFEIEIGVLGNEFLEQLLLNGAQVAFNGVKEPLVDVV